MEHGHQEQPDQFGLPVRVGLVENSFEMSSGCFHRDRKFFSDVANRLAGRESIANHCFSSSKSVCARQHVCSTVVRSLWVNHERNRGTRALLNS